MERKDYIDNLRWMAILLLFPFHAAQIWSGGEYGGFYVWSHTDIALYLFSTAVYPWYMSLLFTLAGMSCRYALQKRSARAFIAERVQKLLVPFAFGLLLLAPAMTYTAEVFFNGYTGGYWRQYRLFFGKVTDLTGYRGGFTPAHLWFLLYLFVISLAALAAIRLQKRYLPGPWAVDIPYPALVLLFIPLWLCQYILNIGGKSLGQFMALFLLGYYPLSDERVLQKLKRYRLVSLAGAALAGALYSGLYCLKGLRNGWMTGLYILFGWLGVIALIGIGQARLNIHGRLCSYLARASYPVYLLHMPVLVAVGFFALQLPCGVAGRFLTVAAVSFAVTFLLYEIIKRVPGLRFFLGIKGG